MTLDTILPFLRPLEALLLDQQVSDIMVNGPNAVFIERRGMLQSVDVRLEPEHLEFACKQIARQLGKEVSEAAPLLDARLADGSRISVVYTPISVDGISLCIRKFNGWKSIQGLIETGSITADQSLWFMLTLENRQNILISGATGTGKSTLLRALAWAIPANERIVTIEDTAELDIQHPNIVRLECRPEYSYAEGDRTITVNAITERELVAKALRMRPDRLILGEVRNGAAWDLIRALNTGHGGSMSTIHANSASDALHVLTGLAMEAGVAVPESSVKARIARAIQFVVHVDRVGGKRCVTEIVRVKPRLEDGEFIAETI